MVNCSVVGCKTRSIIQEDVGFYAFPLDEALREKWRIAAGLTESKVTKNLRICSKHFTAGSFNLLTRGVKGINCIKALKEYAIPTLYIHRPIGPFNTENNVNVRDNKHNMKNNSTKCKQDEDVEIIINSNSDVEQMDANSETECVITDTVTDAETECVMSETATNTADNSLVDERNLPRETRQMIFKLQRKAQIVESQKKTISRLRAKVFRLRKKNRELEATIEIMKNEALKEHKGPSILLVGM